MSTVETPLLDIAQNPLQVGDIVLAGSIPAVLEPAMILNLMPLLHSGFYQATLLRFRLAKTERARSAEEAQLVAERKVKKNDNYFGYSITYYNRLPNFLTIKLNISSVTNRETILIKEKDSSKLTIGSVNNRHNYGYGTCLEPLFDETKLAEIAECIAQIDKEIVAKILTGEDIKKILKPYNAKLKNLTAPYILARVKAALKPD